MIYLNFVAPEDPNFVAPEDPNFVAPEDPSISMCTRSLHGSTDKILYCTSWK